MKLERFLASIQVKSSAPNRTRRHTQSWPRKTHGAKAWLGPLGWQDTAASPLRPPPSPEKLIKCCTPHTTSKHQPGEKRTHHLSLTQRARGQALLSVCPCTWPARPKEGERIKQRISFLFSCKKHLPWGYKCYCICVALYCCPQLASITGSQGQYFFITLDQ